MVRVIVCNSFCPESLLCWDMGSETNSCCAVIIWDDNNFYFYNYRYLWQKLLTITSKYYWFSRFWFTAIQCDQTFDSRMSKNGTFTSPNHPNPYPANVHCHYHFNGQGKERVQILFTDFELYRPDESGREWVQKSLFYLTFNWINISQL